jgi:hypothetical protein
MDSGQNKPKSSIFRTVNWIQRNSGYFLKKVDGYSREDPPCLRRVDSTKRYPRDIIGEVHADGEIWSACLWQIRELLGGERADKLILAHHFLLSRDASFAEAAEALIQADGQLNGGANQDAIREVFVRRGILQTSKRKRGGYDPFRLDNRPHGRRLRRKA